MPIFVRAKRLGSRPACRECRVYAGAGGRASARGQREPSVAENGEVELAKALGVGQDVDRDDLPAAHREGADRHGQPVQGRDRAGNAVDQGRLADQAVTGECERLARDVGGAADEARGR